MPAPDVLREAARRGVDGLLEVTADAPRARRNLHLGLWSGGRLGLKDGALAEHAVAVMTADHEEPGDADVVRAITAAFAAGGVSVPDAELRGEFVAAQRRATEETLHHH